MSQTERTAAVDRGVVLLTLSGLLAISWFLYHAIGTRMSLLFVVGIGLGISLYHGAFGFSGSWRNFIRDRRSETIRAQLLLFALSSVLFFPLLGEVIPDLYVSGTLAPVGISVLVGAFLFGIGMQLGGGCGSGTLYTVGGGHINMLVTLTFFIIGATVGSAHLHWWMALPNIGKMSLISHMGWFPALMAQLMALGGLYVLVESLERKRHSEVRTLRGRITQGTFLSRLITGPWSLRMAVVALSVLGLLTLVIAGHPWSITFAFGLWGAKIWSALGGDVMSWPYWSTGYPAKALNSSVLADTTSVMDFGLILGAVLAAALANKFAPEKTIRTKVIVTAIIGGLLLGYGARLAFGCNIGALLAGIASGSLHGWLWLAAGFMGNIAGVYIRILWGVDKPMGVER